MQSECAVNIAVICQNEFLSISAALIRLPYLKIGREKLLPPCKCGLFALCSCRYRFHLVCGTCLETVSEISRFFILYLRAYRRKKMSVKFCLIGEMGRLLAIDYGLRRTGIAVSDPLQIIAGALQTVPTCELMDFLKKYVSQNDVEKIVVGKPSRMNGVPSETFKYIETLVCKLRKEFAPVEVVYYDERFTSVLAHKAMIDGGVKKHDRQNKALVDKISAAIILQDYMNSKKI